MADLQDALGIETPIVLGPFGGLSSVELTAAVSDLGGLGSFGLYGCTPERIHETVAALRATTDRPFAVNLWLATGDEVQPADVGLAARIAELAPVFDELGLALPTPPSAFLPDVAAQVDAVMDAAPAVLSVVFGVPGADLVERARERGIRIIGTATTVAEAVALDEAGVDAIVATGAEAAGHRVSFLAPAEQSLVGTFALVPQVVDAVRVPVIAAGGVADRRGVAAAFALGASGVQVGTAFLRTAESAAPPSHRRAIADATDTSTVLTRAMSGRLARGIPNRAVRMLEAEPTRSEAPLGASAANGGGEGTGILPFPAQNWLTGQFRAEAGRRDRGDLLSLWAGQTAALARHDRAAEVFAELAAGLPR